MLLKITKCIILLNQLIYILYTVCIYDVLLKYVDCLCGGRLTERHINGFRRESKNGNRMNKNL